jgi:oligopeptidase B
MRSPLPVVARRVKSAGMDKPVETHAPPTAEKRPYSYEVHGVTLEDPYHWLRDPKYPEVDDPDVLAYLKAENAYFDGWKAQHQGLLETLFEEMKGRIKEDDSSVPIRDGDYLYWWAFKPGAQYRTWYRKPIGGGEDQITFDEPVEAEEREYFRLGALEVSPDGKLAATLADYDGSERFELRIRDLATGKDIETVTRVGIGQPVWTRDSGGIVFTEVNDQWRSYRARYHRLGRPADETVTLYEETEEPGFNVGVGKSTDKSLILVSTGDNATSEVRFVPADDPSAPPTLISRRKRLREYHVDAAHGKLWVLTNDDHVNFRLAEADPAAPEDWRTVIPGSDQVYLTGASSYRDHLAISSRVDGLDQLVLRTYSGQETRIPFGEASYTAFFHGNPEFAPDAYRLGYSSMVTPMTTFDYHPASDRLEVLKVQEIPSGYDASQYETERLMVRARDGVQVPVSIVYKKGFEKSGDGKLFLYAYGAYGYAVPPVFNSNRISLLDRGWACAIAHVRGGDDIGHQWFLDGKLAKRMNAFNDFVDVAKGLCAAKFTRPGRIAINGGSAGGELMGAVANSDPELWGAVVADVPFVDVLNTMLDDTLPLTPGEWPEWGHPIADKAVFDLIRSYSPYDTVKAQAYPPMLITGGLTDPRVTYWEPAKWAARLRATKTDRNLLLLKVNMGAGHGGKSGRWDRLHEVAETYAFILTQV